jgi:hypothetical protein
MLKAISRTSSVPKRFYSLVQEKERARETRKHIVSGDLDSDNAEEIKKVEIFLVTFIPALYLH